METTPNTPQKGTFGQFILLLTGFIVVLVGLSLLVMQMMK